jgi:hypothetical protein
VCKFSFEIDPVALILIYYKFVSVSRGVRQRCPITPNLFLLCAEILGIAIRLSKDIKGFCHKRKEFTKIKKRKDIFF